MTKLNFSYQVVIFAPHSPINAAEHSMMCISPLILDVSDTLLLDVDLSCEFTLNFPNVWIKGFDSGSLLIPAFLSPEWTLLKHSAERQAYFCHSEGLVPRDAECLHLELQSVRVESTQLLTGSLFE